MAERFGQLVWAWLQSTTASFWQAIVSVLALLVTYGLAKRQTSLMKYQVELARQANERATADDARREARHQDWLARVQTKPRLECWLDTYDHLRVDGGTVNGELVDGVFRAELYVVTKNWGRAPALRVDYNLLIARDPRVRTFVRLTSEGGIESDRREFTRESLDGERGSDYLAWSLERIPPRAARQSRLRVEVTEALELPVRIRVVAENLDDGADHDFDTILRIGMLGASGGT